MKFEFRETQYLLTWYHLSCQGLLERPTRAWFCNDKRKKMWDLEWEAKNNRKGIVGRQKYLKIDDLSSIKVPN
jgi:hypothetical protein